MSNLTELENELMTRDPIATVQDCLRCTRATCTNCIDWSYRKKHEKQKQGGKQTHGKA